MIKDFIKSVFMPIIAGVVTSLLLFAFPVLKLEGRMEYSKITKISDEYELKLVNEGFGTITSANIMITAPAGTIVNFTNADSNGLNCIGEKNYKGLVTKENCDCINQTVISKPNRLNLTFFMIEPFKKIPVRFKLNKPITNVDNIKITSLTGKVFQKHTIIKTGSLAKRYSLALGIGFLLALVFCYLTANYILKFRKIDYGLSVN